MEPRMQPFRSDTKNPGIGLFSATVAASALMMASADLSRAAVIPSCVLPSRATATTSLENGVPPALLRALNEDVGELVPPGGEFDSTDVVRTGKNRRLIFVWNRGQRWVVATERGGRVYDNPVYAYDIGQDERRAVLVNQQVGNVCSVAMGLLGVGTSLPDSQIMDLVCWSGGLHISIKIDTAAKSVQVNQQWLFVNGKVGSFDLREPDTGRAVQHIVTISPERITFGWPTNKSEGAYSLDRSNGRLRSADPFLPFGSGVCGIASTP
jgi:hypothetical protein